MPALLRFAILAALCGALMAACGQRGPLYLPNPDAPNQPVKK